jgi:hypothetical protein
MDGTHDFCLVKVDLALNVDSDVLIGEFWAKCDASAVIRFCGRSVLHSEYIPNIVGLLLKYFPLTHNPTIRPI